jgi:hypothetical protein
MDRATLTRIHLLLASFLFPVALMFLLTGGLYTWGFKGSYETDVIELQLAAPLNPDASSLTQLVSEELRARSVASPTGEAKIKEGGTSWQFEWTGSRRDVVLEPTADPLMAKLSIKETTWYRNLVQLHKAKGGQLFKVYAAVLAIGLFTILASGFLMAWQVPKFRRLANICAGSGVALFLAVVLLS